MRLQHVVNAVNNQPWMIRPETHRSIRGLLARKLGIGMIESTEEDLKRIQSALKSVERTGIFGPLESSQVVNGVQIIPVKDVLARRVSSIEKSCGVTDYEDICKDLDEAAADANVIGVVLDIDSPGGAVNGLYECADCIAELAASKPVVAFTAGQMCSAAYYLALEATAIVATPSSEVGSVGCILQALDDSEAYRQAGYTMNTVRSDPMKCVGADGDTITPEQIAYLQSIVDEAAVRFKNLARRQRGASVEGACDGRVFSADGALAAGLIDQIVDDLDDALSIITGDTQDDTD